MSKIIFLDIDGVLNISWRKKWNAQCVKNLNQIILLTDAKIVITSTWRIDHSLEDLRKIFINQGVEGEIIDFTPILGMRGLDILSWIKNNNPIDYVVIDDRENEIRDYIQPEKFFKCDQSIGLQDNNIKVNIITTLNKEILNNFF